MSRPKVYLAGPITGQTYEGATDWREYARQLLEPHVQGMSPMRGKDYLKAYGVIGGSPEEAYMKQVISSQTGILGRDRNDVRTADAVLMNLKGAEIVSIGTMIEAGWADAYRIPFVIVDDPKSIHNHVMLRGMATYVVETIEDAVYLLRVLLGVPVLRQKPASAQTEKTIAIVEHPAAGVLGEVLKQDGVKVETAVMVPQPGGGL